MGKNEIVSERTNIAVKAKRTGLIFILELYQMPPFPTNIRLSWKGFSIYGKRVIVFFRVQVLTEMNEDGSSRNGSDTLFTEKVSAKSALASPASPSKSL